MKIPYLLGCATALALGAGASLAADPIVADEPELPNVSSIFGAPPEEARNPLRGVELGSVLNLPVKGAKGMSVGTVEDILLDQSGEASAIVVHEGGFLGFGGRQVQIDVKEINFLLEYSGREITLDSMTAQDVAALPAYQAQDSDTRFSALYRG
ncbi:MAG: hypothetical protein GC199_02305 [Alphaproteobacteria bacterium]|nr:hypothetical protein [Alphaproteobacteria bacterium]